MLDAISFAVVVVFVDGVQFLRICFVYARTKTHSKLHLEGLTNKKLVVVFGFCL